MSDDESLRGSFFNSSGIVEPEIKFPLPENRARHLEDTVCLSCSCRLNVPNVASTIKQICKFCYRGSCERCLQKYYFHSESKNYEKMCMSCFKELTIMSQSFKQELQKARLEKIQIIQEVDLAIHQKESIAKERIIAQMKLKEIQQSVSLSTTEQTEILENLQLKAENTNERINMLKKESSDKSFELGILKERHIALKKGFEKIRKKYDKKMAEISKMKDEFNQVSAKIAVLSKKRDNEGADEGGNLRIEELRAEISELLENIEEKLYVIRDLQGILKISQKNIKQNEEKIEILQEHLDIQQNSAIRRSEYLTEEEEASLADLKKIEESNIGIISTLKERLRIAKERAESTKSTVEQNSYEPSSELIRKRTDKFIKSEDKNKEQTMCSAKCLVV